jgi:TonB family protein
MATQATDTSKPRLRAHGDELTVIAQRAQAFTNASGTAIALSEGNADEIICRAKSGAAAPDVGTALRVEGSFTGLCIQSGKELRCDDAETDTRVDTAAIRALGIRSMVVTPIKEDNKVVGVLASFAPTAHAFTITHVAVLKTMADQISVLLQKERRTRDEGFAPEPSPVVTMPKPAASVPVAPPSVVIKPAATTSPSSNGQATSNGSNGATATAAAPARSPFPVVSKVEPARNAEPAPAAKKEEKRAEARASFGTFDALATEDKKSGLNVKMIGAVAVIVVAAVVTFALLKTRKSDATTTHVQETAQPANTQQPTQANASTPSVPVSATLNSSASTSEAVASNHASSHNSSPAASVEVKKSERNTAEKGRATEPSEKPEKQAPATVALTSGPSRINAGQGQQGGDVAAPTLNLGGNNSSALSALARADNSGAPAASLAQSELEPMKLIRSVPPAYPPIAKVRRLSGQVVVEVKVGKDGKVTSPKFVSGQPVFRDAAFDAVKQWVFRPAKLNGEPIEQTTQIKMDFHP